MPHPPEPPAHAREIFPAHLTFSQRYGYEPLPEPMRLEQLSDDLRRDVWDEIQRFLRRITYENSCYNSRTRRLVPRKVGSVGIQFTYREENIIRCILAKVQKLPETDVQISYRKVIDFFRSIILKEEFHKVLSFLEIILNEFLDTENLTEEITALLDKHSPAYWLDTSQRPYWFFPRVSQEQGEAVQEAIDILHQDRMNNATTHLRQAAEHVKMKQYGDSVADSIHAVESVACEIDSNGNKTLGKALDSLEREGFFPDKANPLKESLKKLHGYANQPGIRHASQEGSTVEVGLDEAMLMYGACASFAAYLTRKHQSRQGRQVPTSPPAIVLRQAHGIHD